MSDAATARDALAALQEHVRDARAAAQRLAEEATDGSEGDGVRATGGDPGATPPRGWEVADRTEQDLATDLRALLTLVQSLHAHLPDELASQLADLARQVLLLARAVVDRLLARLETDGRRPARESRDGMRDRDRARDIPIR